MRGNIFKEYLIKLGWAFDEKGFDSLIDKLNKNFDGLGTKILKFAKLSKEASIIFISAAYSMSKATKELMEDVAELDKQTQLMARQYYTSTDSMMAWNNALQQMEMNYEDLFYATDELKNQFVELDKFGKSMTPPGELENTLVLVRDVGFQLKKLKTIMLYMKQWIVYYLGKMGDLQAFRDKLAAFVEKIKNRMPDLAKRIAVFLSFFLRMAMNIAEFAMNIVEAGFKFLDFLDRVPASIKLVGLALTGLLLGPVGKLVAGLSLIALLIDDYMVWKNGGYSLLDWGSFDNTIKELSKAWNDFVSSTRLDEFFNEAAILALQTVVDLFGYLAERLTSAVNMIKEFMKLFDELPRDKEGNIDIPKTVKQKTGVLGKVLTNFDDTGISFFSNPALGFSTSASKMGRWLGREGGALYNWMYDKFGGTASNTTNNNKVSLQTNDTYYVNSKDEAASIQKKKTNNMIDSSKTMISSPVK